MMDMLSGCTSGGCGAKIGPGELSQLLNGLRGAESERLIVGFDSSDDAAVYQLPGGDLIVSTVDFFSPMVNDPHLFGKIAAANALSDVYAMGGHPLFALNLVCYPEKLPKEGLRDILSGGAEKLREAKAALAGGHSIYDREVKYGLAVTGQVEPGRLLRNDTPNVGDKLILTKPLGVGIVMAAHRVELAEEAHVRAATDSMQRLNKYASEAVRPFPVSACTDVTGFGLLAHLREMVGKDAFTAHISPALLPLLPGAHQYASDYLLTAAGQRNRQFLERVIDQEALEAQDFALQELMFDPQTSGGLLMSIPGDCAQDALSAIQAQDPSASIIGEIGPYSGRSINFR